MEYLRTGLLEEVGLFAAGEFEAKQHLATCRTEVMRWQSGVAARRRERIPTASTDGKLSMTNPIKRDWFESMLVELRRQERKKPWRIPLGVSGALAAIAVAVGAVGWGAPSDRNTVGAARLP